jgi:hypothetical protein
LQRHSINNSFIGLSFLSFYFVVVALPEVEFVAVVLLSVGKV